MKHTILFLLLMLSFGAFKPKPSYQIFIGEKSKAIDFDKMMKGLKDADVVFFGENHNNSLAHWLQMQVLKSLNVTTGKEVIVGAEMFEADDQLILNEYLSGLIKEDHLIKEAKVWDNYQTDYAPLVNYAKEHELSFIATNIPRRYANVVARNGLQALEELGSEPKQYMAPLPISVDYELSSYKEISAMMAGHMGHASSRGKNLVNAQAIKDATMAHFIIQNFSEGLVFYHLNGSFHSKNKQGIVHYLQIANPDLNIVTITAVDQEEIEALEDANQGLADYVIAIPTDMTKTF